MSYNPSQDPNSGYGNPPYGVPPSESYDSPQNPYDVPLQEPYVQPSQEPYGPPLQGSYGQPENPYGYGAPPQSPYGSLYQQPGYGYGMPPVQAVPLPLSEAIRQLPGQYIKVLTKPSAATFAEEMGKGSWGVVWIQLIGLAIIQAVITFITDSIRNSSVPNPQDPAYLLGQSIGENIILFPLFFFIGIGILYLIAKAFRGEGTFVAQGYTYLLFEVPLGIIAALFRGTREIVLGTNYLIPIFCDLVVLAVDIYGIVLLVISLMAVHRLSGGKATLVVFVPVIVVFVLAGIVVAIVVGSHLRP